MSGGRRGSDPAARRSPSSISAQESDIERPGRAALPITTDDPPQSRERVAGGGTEKRQGQPKLPGERYGRHDRRSTRISGGNRTAPARVPDGPGGGRCLFNGGDWRRASTTRPADSRG